MSDPVGYQGPPTTMQNVGAALNTATGNIPDHIKRLAAALRAVPPNQVGTVATGPVGAAFDNRIAKGVQDAGG